MLKLPEFFKPENKCEMIRLGKKNDGGYTIPKRSLQDTNTLIGFGISDDWSFEENFFNLSGAKVLCYDYSVNTRFWIVKFLKNLINFLFLKNCQDNFTELTKYFKYKFFFSKTNISHEKKFIAPLNQKITGVNETSITDLNNIIKSNNLGQIFLKVDIEGSEYRILDQILENQNHFTGTVIEFHDCDLHFDKIDKFIKKFLLQLVHVHVNNYGAINQFDEPTVIELTFSAKKYNENRELSDNNFPVINLDQPNNPNIEDEKIVFRS